MTSGVGACLSSWCGWVVVGKHTHLQDGTGKRVSFSGAFPGITRMNLCFSVYRRHQHGKACATGRLYLPNFVHPFTPPKWSLLRVIIVAVPKLITAGDTHQQISLHPPQGSAGVATGWGAARRGEGGARLRSARAWKMHLKVNWQLCADDRTCKCQLL